MELDLENGCIKDRDNLTYHFKDIVTRKELKVIKELRNKHEKLEEKGIEKLTQTEVENIEDEWFNTVLPLGLKDFKEEDLDTLTEGEIREITASTFVFLTKFGSTDLARQFASSTKEINKNGQKQ